MANYTNFETGSDIICPYCGRQYEPAYEGTYIGGVSIDVYEERTQECTCDNCHKRFTVLPQINWNYQTETIDGEMTEDEYDELQEDL